MNYGVLYQQLKAKSKKRNRPRMDFRPEQRFALALCRPMHRTASTYLLVI